MDLSQIVMLLAWKHWKLIQRRTSLHPDDTALISTCTPFLKFSPGVVELVQTPLLLGTTTAELLNDPLTYLSSDTTGTEARQDKCGRVSALRVRQMRACSSVARCSTSRICSPSACRSSTSRCCRSWTSPNW